MAIRRGSKVSADFNMSSMTDLVFLLLIFFLITSTLINPNGLKLLLPKSTNQTTTKAIASISIKHLGVDKYEYYIGTTPVAFGEIEYRLQQQLKEDEEPTLSLHADRSVPIEQVVNVMNIAKRNRYKVLLATSPE